MQCPEGPSGRSEARHNNPSTPAAFPNAKLTAGIWIEHLKAGTSTLEYPAGRKVYQASPEGCNAHRRPALRREPAPPGAWLPGMATTWATLFQHRNLLVSGCAMAGPGGLQDATCFPRGLGHRRQWYSLA